MKYSRIITAVLAICLSTAVTACGKSVDNVFNRNRYLLLDSRIIESAENAKLTVGAVRKDKNNPLFKEDKPWEPCFNNLYISPIYDRADKLYKCWYSVFIKASKQWCELAWSTDSIKWHRIDPGAPLIANGKHMDDYDWGCVFASPPIFRKDEIRIYYGADKGGFMGWREGYLCLARLRPDGFAGYEQIAGGANKTASVATRPVAVMGGALRVSADVAMSGYVKVTVYDKGGKDLAEGKLITRTVTDAEIKWTKGFSLEQFRGKYIRLRFELRDAKLYSFSFNQ